jgi:predicted HTH transcriptional regulator
VTPDRLELMLDGGQETDSIEFKAETLWNKNLFVKDILALANTLDGGSIIVGVEDGTFARKGVNSETIKSYDIDKMRDQIAPFADPRVVFSSNTLDDKMGFTYIVIEVAPFEDAPVICAKDGADVHKGTIYYRSRSRRPESARVSSSSDMRDIIETAIARRSRQLRRVGFVPAQADIYDFHMELGGL